MLLSTKEEIKEFGNVFSDIVQMVQLKFLLIYPFTVKIRDEMRTSLLLEKRLAGKFSTFYYFIFVSVNFKIVIYRFYWTNGFRRTSSPLSRCMRIVLSYTYCRENFLTIQNTRKAVTLLGGRIFHLKSQQFHHLCRMSVSANFPCQ